MHLPRPMRRGEQPLPFVDRQWLRYLDLLDDLAADFGGDDLAAMAAEDEYRDRLAELIEHHETLTRGRRA